MIRACPPWRGCAAAAFLRKRCAISSSASASPKPTAWSISVWSLFRFARFSTRPRADNAPDGRKVQATLHWVAVTDAKPAEIRLYNPLFTRPNPNGADFIGDLNPVSLEVLSEARIEPALAAMKPGGAVQFERLGYFCLDTDARPDRLVFNRTVGLR